LIFDLFLENTGHDRVHAVRPANTNLIPLTTPQIIVPPRQSHANAQSNNHRPHTVVSARQHEHIERATSPVDERILNEFYLSQPKDVHQYNLEGRQYVVYEGANLSDIETYRRGKFKKLFFCIKNLCFISDLTQAMLLQESEGLHIAIDHARSSIHASALADEIRQAQSLVTKLH
jgi:hypothetical protein